MSASSQEKHLVYLLKRKSDSKQYIGITTKKRMNQRMGDHKRSNRFKGDGFDITILEQSSDRDYIEGREEHWISKYDTYKNGLNETWSGKGYGHRSPNFTTLGYIYSEESRRKMSESAKKRAEREGFEVRSKRSKENFKNPEFLEKQRLSKKGKRLRPPKLSDDKVSEIRKHYDRIEPELELECEQINAERQKRNAGWKGTNAAQLFATKYSDYYGASLPLLKNIVLRKTRTKVLPSLYENSNA